VTTSHPPALQLYTVRDQLAVDRKGVLDQVAAFGYRAAEPFDILNDPAALAADLAAAGLAVCSVHANPAGQQAGPVAAAAHLLGADTVIVPYLPPARFADADGVRAVAAELNGIAARLAGEGLRLGYHNHDHELALLPDGTPALEALAAGLDPAVLLEVDTYWAAVGGQNVPARRAGRLPAHQGRPGDQGRPDDRGRRRADAGRGDPGRGARRLAGGRTRPVRDRHDDRGQGQPGLAGRAGPGPARASGFGRVTRP
jgi:hypothetical protein